MRKVIGWLCIQKKVSIEEMKIFLLDVEAKLKRQALSAQLANTLDNQIADQQIVEGGLEEIERAITKGPCA